MPAAEPSSAPDLLERELPLRRLHAALRHACAGRGRCVVVSGEAGIGKTRLIDEFAATIAGEVHWLAAACDPLLTPRLLGPWVDLEPALPPSLGEAARAGRMHSGLFPELLQWLRGTQPTPVLVLEDLHWADEATLDCLCYLARHVAETGALIVLSHRDDELLAQHPLRRVLGLLNPNLTDRLPLARLSPQAVKVMASRCGRSDEGLHALTSGNPLYLKELLAAPPGSLPASVSDAVLAQADTLSDSAQRLAELVSISPGGLEWEWAVALHAEAAAALDEAVLRGLLVARPPLIGFRHEVVRLAIEGAMLPGRRLHWHAELLQRLQDNAYHAGNLARCLHHAVGAGRTAAVLELAPAAAAAAAALSAHHSAARMLRTALDHAAGESDQSRAELLDAWAQQCTMIHAVDDVLAARREALKLYTRLGDAIARARQLTRLALTLTPRPEAEAHAREAVDILAPRGDSAELSTALFALAVALTNTGRPEQALPFAQRAVAVADATGDVPAQVEALSVAAAVSLSLTPSDEAFAQLERSVQLAMAQGLHAKAATAWVNLSSLSLAHAQFQRLLSATEQGLVYCRARELEFAASLLSVRRVLGLVELARWPEAEQALDALVPTAEVPPRLAATVSIIRARLDALYGRRNVIAEWQVHIAAAAAGQTEFLPADVAGYAAEAAWLRGDRKAAVDIAAAAQAEAGGPWLVGRLRALQRRAGSTPLPADEASPYALEAAGDWRAAHRQWLTLGCRYEAALSLLQGDEAGLRDALTGFIELGATPAADIARRVLRSNGVRGVQRGPYLRTKQDAWGLTARQQDVAALLVLGLGNAEIALRMHRSERTVEHHVSAVLAALGVTTRAQAIAKLARSI